jgi:hypothetical protein
MTRSRPLAGLSLFLLLLMPLAGAAHSDAKPSPFTIATQNMQRAPGMFDVYRDMAKGRVLLGVSSFDAPFLLVTSLPYGLGSNDVGLDRGQLGDTHMVEFRRAGNRVLLVERNTRFEASSPDPLEQRSAREAFAESVLWAGDILAEDSSTVLFDFSSYLLGDRHGIAQRIDDTGQGQYSVDVARSAVLASEAKSFPDNTELESLLTFSGPGKGAFVRDVAMDPKSLTLHQRISLVRLPDAGFVTRRYHSASGGYGVGSIDFSQPLSQSLDVRYQMRFRLDKTDPTAALSPVKKPIVFYLDPGTPEPVRSALLEGANWWRTAFEKAGFKDAYRVELLPAGADPMDIRYNTITWAHRATRGWSYGSAVADPRTGEIIKGAVTLGSQRVRQDILIAESLTAPYGKSDQAQKKALAEQMALARLRQLAAHEVGHSLGFQHNFAASRQGNGSVMDYPHPLLKLDATGGIDINQAYGVGVGGWDDFLVAHAYGQFPADKEEQSLAELRGAIAKAGYEYISDEDSRAPGSSHPDGLLWDFGGDTQKTFDLLMTARQHALANFSRGVLGPERQNGELEARLVPIYLLHRYQTEAVARQLAGASYQYGEIGDGNAGTTPVAANVQLAALQRLVRTLGAEDLALPANVLDLLTPPSTGYERSREYFATHTAPLFDALAAVEASATVSSQFLFDSSRMNRLAWQHARDASQPGIDTMLAAVFKGTWQRDTIDPTIIAGNTVQLASDWASLNVLLDTLESGQLHDSVKAQVRQTLSQWTAWLIANPGSAAVAASRKEAADFLRKYLADPKSVPRHGPAAIPPGAPI